MSYVFEVLFLFLFLVISVWFSWDEMDFRIELLADDEWAAEDDKTGFLSVKSIFLNQFFEKRPISLSIAQVSTIKQKCDKWG